MCVFAGSLPGGRYLPEILRIVKICQAKGAKIVLDSSGPTFKAIVNQGGIWLIKPNVDELNDLLDDLIKDNAGQITRAAGELLDKAENVLVSRGIKGAILVTPTARLLGRCKKKTIKRRWAGIRWQTVRPH